MSCNLWNKLVVSESKIEFTYDAHEFFAVKTRSFIQVAFDNLLNRQYTICAVYYISS